MKKSGACDLYDLSCNPADDLVNVTENIKFVFDYSHDGISHITDIIC